MIVDVTVPLRPDLPTWPGERGLRREVRKDVASGDSSTVSEVVVGAHTGTHMDAPIHFLVGGSGIDALPVDALVGPGFVADLRGVEGAISADHLDAASVPEGCERLLARTRNSGWSSDTSFREDFVAYDESAARWIVDRGIRLVGIDYLSIEPFGSKEHPTHKVLLGAGVVIVEGVDLAEVEPGPWEVIALPLPIPGGDGSPARVLLRREP
ncbi:MAG TPA: cyclase family protein [Actinomycetota bacterium]|nr:cyclase family protein [Actinomycetota bacterium]